MFILQLRSVLCETLQGQVTTVKGDATQESQFIFPLACTVQRVIFNSQNLRANNQIPLFEYQDPLLSIKIPYKNASRSHTSVIYEEHDFPFNN